MKLGESKIGKVAGGLKNVVTRSGKSNYVAADEEIELVEIVEEPFEEPCCCEGCAEPEAEAAEGYKGIKLPFFGKKAKQEEPEEEPEVIELEPEMVEPQMMEDAQAEAAEKERVKKRSRGAAELIFGGAIAAVGVPMLIFPGPGVAAILGGGTLAAKGYLDFANKKDFSPETKQLAADAKDFASQTLLPAGKQVAEGAKDFAQKDLAPAGKRAAEGAKKFASEKIAPAASSLASSAAKKAKAAVGSKLGKKDEDSAE